MITMNETIQILRELATFCAAGSGVTFPNGCHKLRVYNKIFFKAGVFSITERVALPYKISVGTREESYTLAKVTSE